LGRLVTVTFAARNPECLNADETITFFSLSPISGTSREANYAFADGIAGQLWEVITWEAKFNERSDLHTPSRINNQTSTLYYLRLLFLKQTTLSLMIIIFFLAQPPYDTKGEGIKYKMRKPCFRTSGMWEESKTLNRRKHRPPSRSGCLQYWLTLVTHREAKSEQL
jgi:hypothetical protein